MSHEGPPRKPEGAPIEIEPVKPTDSEEMKAFVRKAFFDEYTNDALGISHDDLQSYYDELFTNDGFGETTEEGWLTEPSEQMLYLVARHNGEIIGRCVAHKHSHFENRLDDIHIDPRYQRLGLGMKFWDRTRAFLNPTRETTVDVLPYNEQAIAFYRSLGFVERAYDVKPQGLALESGVVIPHSIKMVRKADHPAVEE